MATNQPVRFFNPEPISYEQYSKGPVDFYNQALDTSSGISVSNPIRDDDDDDESNRPNIYDDGGDGGNNDTENAMQYTLSSDGSGYKASADVTSYGLDDINFGNTDTSLNTYSFTSPIGTLDTATGKYSNAMTMNKTTGDMNHSFSSMFDDYQAGIGAATGAISAQKTSGGKFDTSSIAGFRDSLGRNIDAILGPTTSNRPYGDGISAIEPGIAGAFSPAAPLMGMFGGMNMAQQARNAAAFQATGGTGGALMDVNGTMVSRMPGQSTFMGFGSTNAMGGMKFVYDGNLGGRTHDQMAAFEAGTLGFVPGTLRETFNEATGLYEKTGVKSKYIPYSGKNGMTSVGGTYNPKNGSFVDLNGNTSAMGTMKAAEAYVSSINARFGSTLSASAVALGRTTARAKGIDFEKQMEDDAIKSGVNATGLSFAQINSIRSGNFLVSGTGGARAGLNTKGFSTFSDFRGDSETADNAPGVSPEDVMSPEVQAQVNAAMAAQYNPNPGGGDNNNDGPTGEDQGNYGETEDYKLGGRVGMQEGGPAGFAERPEFVGGNQQPTDQQSIADDVPREVQEGTFVINSAAADEMGRDDVEKMIRQAYQKAGESGMGAGQQGISQEVAIAVSRGEVTIPPHIAKIIGYDRLKKINNRGKKEVSRRQQEREQAAGGGFISRKKLAEGGMPLPKSKPKRVNQSGLADVEFRADLEEFIQNDPLARLGFNLYEKGDVEIKAIVVPAKRKVGIGIAGVYTPKDQRRDPGFISRDFERRAARQGLSNKDSSVAGIHYFEGQNVNYGRAEGKVTLLHELRHHAMRHLNKKYKVPMPTIGREETLMDVQDHASRKQARKVKPSIPENPREKDLEVRQRGAYMSPSANKEIAMYQKIAEEVLKDRKVPKRTKSKEVEGFFTRAMGILGL